MNILSQATGNTYAGITISYSDITNMYTFTDSQSPFLEIQAISTMNSVLGFEEGKIDVSAFTDVQGSVLTTTVQRTTVSIIQNISDKLSIQFFNQSSPTIITISPCLGLAMQHSHKI